MASQPRIVPVHEDKFRCFFGWIHVRTATMTIACMSIVGAILAPSYFHKRGYYNFKDDRNAIVRMEQQWALAAYVFDLLGSMALVFGWMQAQPKLMCLQRFVLVYRFLFLSAISVLLFWLLFLCSNKLYHDVAALYLLSVTTGDPALIQESHDVILKMWQGQWIGNPRDSSLKVLAWELPRYIVYACYHLWQYSVVTSCAQFFAYRRALWKAKFAKPPAVAANLPVVVEVVEAPWDLGDLVKKARESYLPEFLDIIFVLFSFVLMRPKRE